MDWTNEGQISLLLDLDRASDRFKANLCRTWENAQLNDCNVFVHGMRTFTARKGNQSVDIHCALEYPNVYFSFSWMNKTAGGGWYPSRDAENFDVHEHASNVMLMVEHSLAQHIGKDKTMQKLMREALDKMEKAIKEDK